MKLTKLKSILIILILIICIFLLFLLTPIGLSEDQSNTLNSIQVHDNGTYMRLGHLSTSTTYLQKRIIPAGMVLGYAGSTGFSTGVHVHADFWNKDRQLISVEQFARGIR